MPVAAEVDRFLLFLHHLEDVGKAFESGDERVMAGRAEIRADLHQIPGLDLLVAEHQHRVLEERPVDLAPVAHRAQVHSAHFGAQRSGERLDYHPESLCQNALPSSARAHSAATSAATSPTRASTSR